MRPTLEYIVAVLDPLTTGQVKQVEKVQCIVMQAARFANRNYYDRTPGSIKSVVTNLKLEPQATRRVKLGIMLFYKFQHEIVAIPADLYATATLRPEDSTLSVYHHHSNMCIENPSSLEPSGTGTKFHVQQQPLVAKRNFGLS